MRYHVESSTTALEPSPSSKVAKADSKDSYPAHSENQEPEKQSTDLILVIFLDFCGKLDNSPDPVFVDIIVNVWVHSLTPDKNTAIVAQHYEVIRRVQLVLFRMDLLFPGLVLCLSSWSELQCIILSK